MMRRRLAIAAILAALAAIGMAAPVSATGNCENRFQIFDEYNSSSGWTYCYTGVDTGDVDMVSEPGSVIGPLSDGSFHNDFDNASTTSGIGAYSVYEVPYPASFHRKVCLYSGKSYQNFLIAIPTTAQYDPNNRVRVTTYNIGSFYWTTPNTACAGE